MKSLFFHRLVECLASHDDLRVFPSRIDISHKFFPLSPQEFKILRDCLKMYISAYPRLSYDFESQTDAALSLLIKLTNSWKDGKAV